MRIPNRTPTSDSRGRFHLTLRYRVFRYSHWHETTSVPSSHTFTYINRVVEGPGASFNWRLCYYEMPERNPAACHHKVKHNSRCVCQASTLLGVESSW